MHPTGLTEMFGKHFYLGGFEKPIQSLFAKT